MRRLLFLAVLLASANSSYALNKYYTNYMRSDEVANLIQNEKRVILWYPSKNPKAGNLFGIFVSDSSGCGTGQSASTVSVSAGDGEVNALVCIDVSATMPTSKDSGTAPSASTASAAPSAPAAAPANGGGLAR